MLEPIYRNRTYEFEFPISVNGNEVDVSNDEVYFSMDENFGVDAPVIRKAMDVSSGRSKLELAPTETVSLALKEFKVQINWIPFGSTKNYPVLDEKVRVLPVIK